MRDCLRCLETIIAHALISCSNTLPSFIPLLQEIECDIHTWVQVTSVQSDVTMWYTVLGTYAILATYIDQVTSHQTHRGLFPSDNPIPSPQPLPSTPNTPTPTTLPTDQNPNLQNHVLDPNPSTSPPSNAKQQPLINSTPHNPMSFNIHFPSLTTPSTLPQPVPNLATPPPPMYNHHTPTAPPPQLHTPESSYTPSSSKNNHMLHLECKMLCTVPMFDSAYPREFSGWLA